jgi:hypothetical protein
MRHRNPTTQGFFFGFPEAEGEVENMSGYFDDFLGILENIKKGRFIFVGRKGSGKSAIVKHIFESLESNDDELSHAIRIKGNDIALELLLNKDSIDDRSQTGSILFEWIILCSLAKMVAKNRSAVYTTQHRKLEMFLERNRGVVDVGRMYLSKVESLESMTVNLDILHDAFKTQMGRHMKRTLTSAPFYRVIEPLRDIVCELLSMEVSNGARYRILFDDLDLMFSSKKPNESELQALMELFRMAKDYNVTHLQKYDARVLLFIRDDIAEKLKVRFPDAFKLVDGYQIKIAWYSPELFKQNQEDQIPLRQLVNRRIDDNLRNLGHPYDTKDPWSSLFADDIYPTSFKFVLDYTFYRPRDLVLFLNTLGEESYRIPVVYGDCQAALRRYAHKFMGELRNEMTFELTDSQSDELFDELMPRIIKHIKKGSNITYDEMTTLFKTFNATEDNSRLYADVLIRYGLVGLQEDGRWYFSFREAHLPKKSVRGDLPVQFAKVVLLAH